MNLLDFPLPVLFAIWLLRRLSKRRKSQMLFFPDAVYKTTLDAANYGLSDLLPNNGWLYRTCNAVVGRFLEKEQSASRILSSIGFVFVTAVNDDDKSVR